MSNPKRIQTLYGKTYKDRCGCGTLYVTINELDGKPFEVFVTIGKNGGCQESLMRAFGLTIALGLQHGTPMQNFIHSLKGVKCHNTLPAIQNNGHTRYSCVDALAKVFAQYLEDKYGIIPPVEQPPETQQTLNTTPIIKPKPITDKQFKQFKKIEGEMSGITCPECGGLVIMEGGCDKCVDCGFSKNCG
jgi:ribonucleoside-diphosphate reductase alpha chain